MSVQKVIDHTGRKATFHHRDTMRARMDHPKAKLAKSIPATVLPVDWTADGSVACPMDGNDTYGDCMVATAAHVDNIWTFGRGEKNWTESSFRLDALEKQYLAASGGDNGLDEPTLLTQVWKPGVGENEAATYDDSLDVNVNNVALAQYCIDQFGHICMMWSVPDDFVNNFVPEGTWDVPDQADPENGHGTPLTDVDKRGYYRLYTWGAWVWVSPAFVKSVDPACWVTLSRRQFDSNGFDARGRHVSDVAQAWTAIGGSKAKASALVAMFPAVGPTPAPVPDPTPDPTPAPTGPVTLSQAERWARAGIRAELKSKHGSLLSVSQAEAGATRGLKENWPK